MLLDAEDEEGATLEWHRLMASREKPSPPGFSMPVKGLLKLHLDFVKQNRERGTYDFYQRFSKSFSAVHPALTTDDIRPHHVDSWLSANEWAQSTRRGAVTAIKGVFGWAKKRGYIDVNPLENVEKPRRTRRKIIISTQDVGKILDEMKDDPFRRLFLAIMATGCRPGEAMRVEARHFDPKAATWTMHGKTTNATGKPRVVYLPDGLVEVCLELAKAHPTGPLFRNSKGDPWTRQACGHRVRYIRDKLELGKGVALSTLRHLFATTALVEGKPIATVSELLGHSNVKMVSEVYSMLHQQTDYLRDAVNSIKIHGQTSPSATPEARAKKKPSPSDPSGTSRRKRRDPPA